MSATLQQPEPDRAELQQAARRLTRTVDHLLDATRLESGLLQPVREWCDPAELVREAVTASGLNETMSASTLPTTYLLSLSMPVWFNKLWALCFRMQLRMASNEPIEVSVARDDSMLVISVADHGPGLLPAKKTKCSRNFIAVRAPARVALDWDFPLRVNWSRRTGGEIVAQNRQDGGARFSIRLPSASRCDCPRKRPHEAARPYHR